MKSAAMGSMRSCSRCVAAMAFAWAVAVPASGQIPARETQEPTGVQLLCAADRPLVHPGESVVVRGWIIGEGASPSTVQWRWRAAVGNVDGADMAVWRFAPGERSKEGSALIATVEALTSGGATPTRCSVEVVLAEKPEPVAGQAQSRGDPTARAFLLTGQRPPPGFGMYSYLLLGAVAVDAVERERHVNAVALFLSLIRTSAEFEQARHASQLNLALLPVKHEVKLPDNVGDTVAARALAARVLESYDYARAESLLADLCAPVRNSGPYLVASRGRGGECPQPNLLLDMSDILPELVPDWIRTFRSLATAERSWGNDTMNRLRLNTRNVIAVAYRGATGAAQDISQWVRLLNAAP